MTGYGILAIFVLLAGAVLFCLGICFLVRRGRPGRSAERARHPVKTSVTFIIIGVILLGLAIGEFIITG